MLKRGLKLYNTNIDCYTDDIFKLFDNEMFDYIELYIVPDNIKTLDYWKMILDELGADFVIHNANSSFGFNPSLAEFWEQNRRIFSQSVYFANELNAKSIIIHGGVKGEVEEVAKQLKFLNDERILIENKPILPVKGDAKCVVNTPNEIDFVMRNSGCGFCLDFGHAYCAANTLKIEPYSFIESFLNLDINMYHLTDVSDPKAEIDSHLHLGDGYLDIKRCISYIKKDARVTFETQKDSKENLNDFKNDMLWLEKILKNSSK